MYLTAKLPRHRFKSHKTAVLLNSFDQFQLYNFLMLSTQNSRNNHKGSHATLPIDKMLRKRHGNYHILSR